ncbi:TPA: hypothetical protein NPO56_004409 [Klebsiella quasipneumoniae subsp. quasipneumoniae]|nr:hypothetical protein [Klebsiella quasipneumoniae]HCI6119378.1 hypothetical protein [Klebsiella quasipneumoniae subsp. quasipneumoniae]HCI6267247.1 hypothetical protein [Klebsiella quasipneumoniae subsp. quasipneumoniae]HCI6676037.1 hypothetical protein [Klebsiella quasipneumoniae subsp. quasipneumoniae]HDG7810816.1 hypothetical protein [Klebsiella quasipneumoniae]
MKRIIAGALLATCSATAFTANADEGYALKCGSEVVALIMNDVHEYALIGPEGEKLTTANSGKGEYMGVDGVAYKGLSSEVFAHVHNTHGEALTGAASLVVNANDSFSLIYYGEGAQRHFNLIRNGKNDECIVKSYDANAAG